MWPCWRGCHAPRPLQSATTQKLDWMEGSLTADFDGEMACLILVGEAGSKNFWVQWNSGSL